MLSIAVRAMAVSLTVATLVVPLWARQPQQVQKTRIVFLGTGAPPPLPDRSGPATAIVVNDTAYLIDLGAGVVRRANEAFLTKHINALEPTKLRVAFLTHLHSDHTVGYPDLIFTPWTIGRRVPLDVYGPRGIKAMTEHLLEAYRVDIDTRTNAMGIQHDFPDGHKVNAHEVTAGVVYRDANVTVTAFPTKHAMESYGYRFDTADRSIVISGDTNPTPETIAACRGCDVLIHEVLRPGRTPSEVGKRFADNYHTTIDQLTELARHAKPGLLIIYHQGATDLEGLFDEFRAKYSGPFVISRDLDVF